MNFRRSLYAAVLMALLVVCTGHTTVAHAAKKESADKSLQGTWTVQVQLVDCVSGAKLGNPFSSLLTFAEGGTETDTTANPAFYPSERSAGHGIWSRTDGNNYSASSTAFITLNGALVETQNITQAIQMGTTQDSFTSTASVEFFDPSGNLLASACATAAAARFK